MRQGLIIAVLAVFAVTAGGCTKTDKISSAGTIPTNPGTGTTNNDGIPDPTPLSTGNASYAFNSNSQNPANNQLSQLTIANQGQANETATVAVDPKNDTMAWPEPIAMGRYDAVPDMSLGGQYSEYRRIIRNDTDAELQLWNYPESFIGQYRVWEGGDSTATNNLAVFYGGNKTPRANVPKSGQATYTGQFGGTATASNWLTFDRSTPDNFAQDPSSTYSVDPATGDVTAMNVDPNGEWRVVGDASITANFAAGAVNGRIDNMTWRKFQPNPPEQSDGRGYITVTEAEGRSPFPNFYNMAGQINGADYSGAVSTHLGYVNGANGFKGSFFGANATETAGVMFHQGTAPDPNDGQSPYESRRRGFMDIRGIFHGAN